MSARVLVCDHIHPSALEVLRPLAEITETGPLSEAQLCECIAEYDALLVRSQTRVTAQALARGAGKLKIVARAGVGVDNIDVTAATQQGIVVVNSPEGNTIAAAEHTLGLMFALARAIPAADASLKRQEWRRNDFMGVELYGKTLGVVGLGKIGSHVARVARSLGMHVIGYDPFINAERAEQLGVEVMDLSRLFAQADLITLHVPNTPETRHLINARTLAAMKTGVRIINCARGELIDTDALVAAIQAGQVAGAALDVFEKEPLKNSPLQELGERVVLTPHLGASTEEAQVNVALDVAAQVAAVLRGEQAQNALNLPSLMPHLMREVKPFFPLAEKLGSFMGQLQLSAIREVRIRYLGELAHKPSAPLTVAVLHGLLRPALQERVNYVNAQLLARERGIIVTETRSAESPDYAALIEVEVLFTDGERQVAGTLLGEKQERIVQIDHFPISCVPQGCLLVIPHPDKPGMVGVVGDFLGQHDINISGIQLGRQARRGAAVMVVNIDEALSSELLMTLQTRSEFAQTRLVILN
jgi:D-3-phosphoglycerate dehydrogenase